MKKHSMACKHCGDRYQGTRCKQCQAVPRGACPDCHNEIAHGIIPDIGDNIPICGNITPMGEDDAQYHPGICDKLRTLENF